MEYMKKKHENHRAINKDKRIRLNLSGTVFETWLSTLTRVPGTRLSLLAQLQETDETWDNDRKEYFFDRHAGAFVPILHYYRTEELHVDQNICGNIIKEVSTEHYCYGVDWTICDRFEWLSIFVLLFI